MKVEEKKETKSTKTTTKSSQKEPAASVAKSSQKVSQAPVEKPSQKAPAASAAKSSNEGFFAKTYNLLFHGDVYYRIGGYLLFGLLLFLISWLVFFFVVKQSNTFNHTFMVQKVFKTNIYKGIGAWALKTFGEAWKIFGQTISPKNFFAISWLTVEYFVQQLLIVTGFIFFFNYFKVGRWNLGLLYMAFITIMWGGVIGTNSLDFPFGDNKVFGPLLLFTRFGLWYWFAYLLLTAATTQFTWMTAPNWTTWSWEKVRGFWQFKLEPDQREILIYGLLFLLAASFAEARIFIHYNAF